MRNRLRTVVTRRNLPTPTRDGYTFVGWTTDAAGTTPYGFGMPVTGGITLYAKWDDAGATYHTVTIHLNDGDDYSSDLPQDMTLFVKEGEKLTIPDSAPSRGGYRFAGLTSDEQRKTDYDAGTAVTADMTLYVKWVKTWTVTFDTAGRQCREQPDRGRWRSGRCA